MPEATPQSTGYVILGLLDVRPRTGYEIKQAVETSTRFFWAASYGQIYPELRRLREAGLLTSERDDEGGRRRERHRITAAGRKELRRWLRQPAETFELRDEALLKLFFADSAGPRASEETGSRLLEEMAARHTALAEKLRELEPRVVASGDPYQLAVLRYGIGLGEWGREHCERAAAGLTSETDQAS